MIELILIILIIATSAIVFDLQNRRQRQARREARRLARLDELRRNGADMHTVGLIGEEAYNAMTIRINHILDKHKMQPCISVKLTIGPDTKAAARRLHKILPGEEVKLNLCSEQGVKYVDVYSKGERIGRLTLMENLIVRETMETNHLRGAYVAEQNCYGIKDSHELSVIIFYEPKDCTAEHETRPQNAMGKMRADICEN